MFGNWSERLPAAVLRAAGHWDAQHQRAKEPSLPAAASGGPRAMTIALSRQLGTPSHEIAMQVGAQLRWPVFDRELLQRIADELHVRVELLESLDERPQSWLLESLAALGPRQDVSEISFLRRLVETLFSLAAHGECVIVGRGAAQVLPAASTLRVRVIAPWETRVTRLCHEQSLQRHEAQRRLSESDRERAAFVKEHFQRDPDDPQHYDLILNSAWLQVADCAAVIVAALRGRSQSDSGQSPTPAQPVAATA